MRGKNLSKQDEVLIGSDCGLYDQDFVALDAVCSLNAI